MSAGQRRVDQAAQPLLGVRGRVPGLHGVPAGQEVGHPAAADDAGADTGDGPDPRGDPTARPLIGAAAT